MMQFNQIAQQSPEAAQFVNGLKDNLVDVRKYILSADALRSFVIVLIGLALLLLYRFKKLNAQFLVGCIALLCLIDMWQVDKRYLNDGMFVEKSVRDTPQQKTATDEIILKDKSLDYRVLNLAGNTFSENNTSFYHKSIGGYHPAKLRRYQELVDAYIGHEMQKLMPAVATVGGDMTKVNGDSLFPVINMLNTKYLIVGLQNNQTVPIQNPYANGNAWFVDKVDYVDNANQELDGLANIDLRTEAIADKKFEKQLGKAVKQGTVAMATLTKYEPNNLVYEVNSDKGGVLVFSEIYYPGWTATVDGQPTELGRVNYVLRAMNIKPGKHQVVLDFHPSSIRQTEAIAYTAYAILAVLAIFGIFVEWRKHKHIKAPSDKE